MKIIPIKPIAAQEVEQALFEVRKKIYPRALTGWFATWRWVLVWFTQIVFYGGAWLGWNGRQAVLFDLAARKFYIFGLVLWPQDFIYLAILLVISALSLFLFTAIAGRLFCGYACPQTVYTEIFMWIERKIEGDRTARMRFDKELLSMRKIARISLKHFAWISLSLWTGLSFVGYFTPIRDLVREVSAFTLGPWEYFWIFFYALATYGNAGWLREQVCKYMCPYARFQSAMFDRDTLTITYDAARGEPRGSRSKKADFKMLGLGTCVDCNICVHVCPTGIDIRDGLQYECIGCAACIDACDQVMEKMAYPKGLIRYTTEHALENNLDRAAVWKRVLRPRTLIYSGILGLIVAVSVASLSLRLPLKVNVMLDRGVPHMTENGAFDNVYRLQVMNTEERPHRFEIAVAGLPGVQLMSESQFEMSAASTKAFPVRVRVPKDQAQPGSNRITFQVRDLDNPNITITEKAVFLVQR